MSKTPDWFDDGWPHIWLPYAQMQTTPAPLPVVSASGCKIKLEDGRELIDGTASWWSMCHGYQHPNLVNAIKDQAGQLSHVMFAGLAHEPAYKLAKTLADMTPDGLTRSFFSDSGSTAVEVALKMALQYWKNKGKPRKGKFLCFENGYHGDTFGAMSVSGRGGMHAAFDSLKSKQYVVQIPSDEYGMAEFAETVAGISDQVAGLIMEPLVQGAGGMRFHSPDILAEIHRICRENDVLFIADEIMTGFARTGTMFACNEAAITPDILCLGKSLTGGHAPLAVTMATDDVFDAFLSDDLGGALMHGPTFMAHPLGCAAANASLALFQSDDYIGKVEAIESHLSVSLEPCRAMAGVKDVRVRGAIGVVQVDATQDDMFALRHECIDMGVWLRPFNDIIYIMPPLVISLDELSQLTDCVVALVQKRFNKG